MTGKFFVTDAETDGLYGRVLSVAAKVIDGENTINHFYGAVKVNKDELESEWVIENVYPYLKNAEVFFETEQALLEAFWQFYREYCKEYTVLAQVPYPVEMGLFYKCIMADKKERERFSPFPLLDLESMLVAKGYGMLDDVIIKTKRISHDAMNDVDNIIDIVREVLI